MKLKYFLALVVILISCSCDRKDNTAENAGLKEVRIDFANATMKIPKIYERFEADELIEIINDAEISDIEADRRIARIEKMLATNHEFIVYADTSDINNSIIFVENEHVSLTEDLVRYHAAKIDRSLELEGAEAGISVKRVDNQYYSGRMTQLLKLKYEFTEGDDLVGYSTEYLFTTSTRTIGIFVHGTTADDYEELVLDIKFKP